MCSHSLDHLIDLAQRTGDRLIVHDPIEGRDVVIMDVREYEKMWDEKQETEADVRGLSGRGLLDKINRDIAVWRADQDMENDWENEMMDEEFGSDDFNPHNDDWYHIGDVMNERSKDQKTERSVIDDWNFDEEKNSEAEKLGNFEISDNDTWDFGNEDVNNATPVSDEIKIEDLPDFDFGLDDLDKKPVPHKTEEGSGFKEEPLDDEPVFYEEPV